MAEPAVCVLGMMRTGTSLAAALLEALGVSFGPPDRLIAPNRANPTGFREHRGMVALNDRLLARFGGSWHAPPTLPPGWVDDALAAEGAAASALISELAAVPPWGWKEPRTCLTLPFWRALTEPATYVICVRHPVAAAESLLALPWAMRRMGSDPRHALDLWLRYVSDVLAATEGSRRLVLFYDDVLASPHAAASRLAALLDKPAPAADARVAELARPDLRHHEAPPRAGRHPAEQLYVELRGSEPTG